VAKIPSKVLHLSASLSESPPQIYLQLLLIAHPTPLKFNNICRQLFELSCWLTDRQTDRGKNNVTCSAYVKKTSTKQSINQSYFICQNKTVDIHVNVSTNMEGYQKICRAHQVGVAHCNKLCAWRHNMPPPLQVDNIFAFIRQVAPVSACWLFKTSAPSWPLTFWAWKWCPSHAWRGLPLCQF